MSSDKWARGYSFPTPNSSDELDFYLGWFYGRLSSIVNNENHILKMKDMCQILKILKMASKNCKNSVEFAYVDGKLHIFGFHGKEDVLNLPKVAKEFGKIYRHRAKHFEGCTKRERELFNMEDKSWEKKVKKMRENQL